jgi:hypothetical protein
VLGYDDNDVEDDDEFEEEYNGFWNRGNIIRVVFHPDYTSSDFTGHDVDLTGQRRFFVTDSLKSKVVTVADSLERFE